MALPAIVVFLGVYFSYHAVQGDRGLLALWHLDQEITLAEQNKVLLHNQNRALAHRVERLRPETLDPDLIRELAYDQALIGSQQDKIILNATP